MALTLIKQRSADLEAAMADSRSNWQRHTALLADEVQTWTEQEAAARGWRVEREEKQLAEEIIGGAYHVPVVTIYAPQGRLVLEPIARGVIGAQGRVDLYAWPSSFRVMLLHKPHGKGVGLEWVVRTESGVDGEGVSISCFYIDSWNGWCGRSPVWTGRCRGAGKRF